MKKTTKNFLKSNEKLKKIEPLSSEFPRSFIICGDNNIKKNEGYKIYLSPINPTTLIKTKSN